MSEEEIERTISIYQTDRKCANSAKLTPVPAGLKGADQVSLRARMALTVIGGIVLHRYQSVTPTQVTQKMLDSILILVCSKPWLIR